MKVKFPKLELHYVPNPDYRRDSPYVRQQSEYTKKLASFLKK